MDQRSLYEKAEKALNQAFEIAKASVKIVSEKAGEAAQITKLLIEKASLEHKVSKKFTELGNRVYQKSAEKPVLEDQEIRSLIEETQKLDRELSDVETRLENERKKSK